MGRTIRGLELKDPLGRGSVSTVYSADLDDGTPVAVKVFDLQSATEQNLDGDLAMADFANVVETTERLAAQPNAPVIGVCRTGEDGLSIIYHLAANGSCEDLVALGWGSEQLMTFFRKVCDAVQWAHEQGVPHGNLKPSNVLLDENLKPQLSDFGAVFVRTSFSAPESELDFVSDIYSLGRLLMHMFVGEASTFAAEDLPRLEELDAVAPDIRRIVRKCTMRTPAERYQSVFELLEDLDRSSRGESVGVPLSTDGGPSFAPPSPEKPAAVVEPKPKSQRATPAPRSRSPDDRRENLSLAISPKARRTIDYILAGTGLAATILAPASFWLMSVQTATHSFGVRVAAAIGVGLLAFALPPMHRRMRIMRVLLALGLVPTVFLLDVSKVERVALQSQVTGGTLAEKRAAVERLLNAHARRHFAGTDLRKVDLSGLNFEGAEFEGADLSGASFARAHLFEARLGHAKVAGTDFAKAVLVGSSAASASGWLEAHCDAETHMPEGWQCVSNRPAKTASD